MPTTLSVTLVESPAVDEIVLVGCGRFPVVPSRADLERFCFLDDADRRLIAKRRGDHNRLGFALQVVTVRYLGTFLADPLDVPTAVTAYVAGQLEIADPSCVKAYLEREKTRFEHQWVIAEEYGWRSFADVEAELTKWVEDRAWTTGDGPGAISDAAVLWLRERRVLLPGVTTLARLVARVRDEVLERSGTPWRRCPPASRPGSWRCCCRASSSSMMPTGCSLTARVRSSAVGRV